MKFAKIVFTIAGIWGVVVLVPLFGLVDLTGRHYSPPMEYPHFFYGFLSVALAWQIAFLVIGSDPIRFRPLVISAAIEKLGYILTVAVLNSRGRLSSTDTAGMLPDLLLGILFIVALLKTPTYVVRRKRELETEVAARD